MATSFKRVLRRPVEIALAAAIAMMDQVVGLARRALADGLVQGVEHETGGHRGRDTPADNLASEDIDDESHVNHALPA